MRAWGVLRVVFTVLALAVAGEVHAAPSGLCPGHCDGGGAACGADSDCEEGRCRFDEVCLPGLAGAIAAVVPEGPGGLNDPRVGWTCGLLRCEAVEGALSFRSEYGIAAAATKDFALAAGRRYLVVAEVRADAGTWGYFEVASSGVTAVSDGVVGSEWRRASAFFEVPSDHVGPMQLRLHADGPGACGLRRVMVLELRELGTWVRWRLVEPAAPARFAVQAVMRHDAGGRGAWVPPCEGDATGCYDAGWVTVDAAAGEATPWVPLSAVIAGAGARGVGARGERVTWGWEVRDPLDGAPLSEAKKVTLELAWREPSGGSAAELDEVLVGRYERSVEGPRIGVVLPAGVPHPEALAAGPDFLADLLKRDRGLVRADEAGATARGDFRIGARVEPMDGLESASPVVREGLWLLADLGLDVAEFLRATPTEQDYAAALALGLEHRVVEVGAVVANQTRDLDLVAIEAEARAQASEARWRAALGGGGERVAVTEGGARFFAGAAYTAAYRAWLVGKVSPAELGVASFEELTPLGGSAAEIEAARPPVASGAEGPDAVLARRYVWAARFAREARRVVDARVGEALVSEAGATVVADPTGSPREREERVWGEAAEAVARTGPGGATSYLGDVTLGGQDDCNVWQIGALADWGAGVASPRREAAAATGTELLMMARVSAERGDLGAKLMELAARGFRWFEVDGYGPRDVSLRPAAGGLGEGSRAWLERVQSGARALRGASMLEGATRVGVGLAILASESDPIWTDEPALSDEELGWHIALTQAHYPVEFMLESEVEAGLLENPLGPRKVLIVTRRHVSRAAWTAIRRWVEGGGTLILGGGLALADEYGQPDREREDWLALVAGAPKRGPETVRWASSGGISSFTVTGTWRELIGLGGTTLAVSDSGAAVAQRLARGRGKVVALGVELGVSYRVPETTCDASAPAAIGKRAQGFSQVMREAMSALVESGGVGAPVRSESANVVLHRMRARDGKAFVLAIPWASGSGVVTAALTIPEASDCNVVHEELEGYDLPVTFGAIFVSLEKPAIFTWHASQCGPAVAEAEAEVAEAEPKGSDEGCAGGGLGSVLGVLMVAAVVGARRGWRGALGGLGVVGAVSSARAEEVVPEPTVEAAEEVVPEPTRPGGWTRDPDAVCPAKLGKVLAIGSSTMGAPLGTFIDRAMAALGLRSYRLAAASSGLARPDFWDWAAKARRLVAEHDPDVVVVQIGSNDYQPITWVETGRIGAIRRGKPEWAEIYAKRIDELLEVLGGGERERLIIWIGPYAYWGDNATEQGPVIDALLRDRIATWVAKGGFARYVDVWRETWHEKRGPTMKRRLPGTRGEVEIRSSDNVHLNAMAVRVLLSDPVVAHVKACLDAVQSTQSEDDGASTMGAREGLVPEDARP